MKSRVPEVAQVIAEFRQDHHLSEDPGYDELLVSKITELSNSKDMELDIMRVDLRTFARKVYPGSEEKQKEFREYIMDLFVRRVLDRLYRYVIKEGYEVDDYFNLEVTDGIPDGQRVKDLNWAVKKELELAKNLESGFDYIPSDKATIVYSSPIEVESAGKIIVHTIIDAGEAAPRIATPAMMEAHTHSIALGHAFGWAGAAFALLNFVMLPVKFVDRYRKATQDNKKFTIKAKDVFNVALSVVMTGLVIASAIVTLPLALGVMAIAIGGLFMAASVKMLRDVVVGRREFDKQEASTEAEIESLTKRIHANNESIVLYRDQLEKELQNKTQNTMRLDFLSKKIHDLNTQYKNDCKHLQTAKMKQELLAAKKSQIKHPWPIVGSISGLVLAGLVVAGAACMFVPFAQPVGAALLLAAGVMGGVLAIGSKIHQIWSRRKAQNIAVSKNIKPGHVSDKDDQEEHGPHIRRELTKKHHIKLDSTATMYSKLIDEHHLALEGLKEDEVTLRMENMLNNIISLNSKEGIINFFKRSDEIVNDEKIEFDSEQWLASFANVNEVMKEKAFDLYDAAIKDVKRATIHLSESTIDELENSEFLRKVYERNGRQIGFAVDVERDKLVESKDNVIADDFEDSDSDNPSLK